MRIVDTPGTGSINVHNTETTYSFLPEADAALFVLSADQPASITELNFLNDAKDLIDKFFFVQNKIDILTDEERKETLEFLTRGLADQLGSAPTVYPISARRALSGQLEKTEDEDFLKTRTSNFWFSIERKSKDFCRQCQCKNRTTGIGSETID